MVLMVLLLREVQIDLLNLYHLADQWVRLVLRVLVDQVHLPDQGILMVLLHPTLPVIQRVQRTL